MKDLLVKVLALLIALPLGFPAAAQAAAPPRDPRFAATDSPLATSSLKPIADRQEVISKRTDSSSTYIKKDGTKETVVYSSPIHYPVANGTQTEWKDIDSTLVPSSQGAYANAANSFSLSVQPTAAKGISMSYQGSSVSLWLTAVTSKGALTSAASPVANSAGKVASTKITYPEVAPGTDLVYHSTNTGTKEDIVLKSYAGQNQYVFGLNATGLDFKKETDGSYSFSSHATGKQVFLIPRPIMWDSAGGADSIDNNLSTDVSMEVVGSGSTAKLFLTANDAWLRDPARAFPVTVDPSLTVGNGGLDTYVQEGYPTYNMWVNRDMYVGRGDSKLVTRALIPFSVPDLTHARIAKATASVYQTHCSGSCTSSPVTAWTTRDYDPQEVRWNDQPDVIRAWSSATSSTEADWVNFDVTDVSRMWYEGGNSDGSKVGSLEFRQDNSSDWGYRQWIAENNPDHPDLTPHLTIDYNDYNGTINTQDMPNDFLVDQRRELNARVYNDGRNTWSASNTYLSYHIYDMSGNLITYDGVRSPLPRDVGPGGDWVDVVATILLPGGGASYYMVKWDIVQEGVTWLSDQGIPTHDTQIHVNDYPEYAATYYNVTVPGSMVGGTQASVSLSVMNGSRYDWDGGYDLGYHWYDQAGNLVVWNSPFVPLPRVIGRRSDFTGMVLPVRAPLNPGIYTLKIDMLRNGISWFQSQGVPTYDTQVTVTTPVVSADVHQGPSIANATLGPVDLGTGSLNYAVTDLSVPSPTAMLSFSRTYTSSNPDTTFVQDANGYIKTWLFNGPYREADQSVRLTKDYLGNEATVRPSGVSNSNGYPWFSMSSPDPIVDLNRVIDTSGGGESYILKGGAMYANAYVYAPSARSAQLRVGSDDGMRAWLNGKQVVSNDVYGPLTVDGTVVPVTLDYGWNKLLLKVTQGDSIYALSARFTDTAGKPFTDLSYDTNDPAVFGVRGVLGKGWTSNLDEFLNTSDPNNVYYRNDVGTVVTYSRNADGSYRRPTGSYLDLVLNSGGTYSIKDPVNQRVNFAADGRIMSRSDAANNTLTYTYAPSSRRIVQIKGGTGTRTISFAYSADGTLATVSDLANDTYSYQYVGGRLASVTDPLGAKISYAYDTAGKMVANTDKRGYTSKIAYAGDRVSSLTDPLGNATKFDTANKIVTITNPLGRVSKVELNDSNQMVAFTDAKGYREIYQYDGYYNLVNRVPDIPENSDFYYKWSYSYDGNGNKLTETDPLGNLTTNQYANNDLVKTTAADGTVTSATYDSRHMLLTSTDAKGNVTKNGYTDYVSGSSKLFAAKTLSVDPSGATTKFSYTMDGDVSSTTSPQNETTSFAYDSLGRKVKETSPVGTSSTYAYDALGRLVTVTDPGGLAILYSYDGNGNKTAETDPKGNVQKYVYDAMNRLTQSIDALGYVTAYAYDKVGNKISMTLPGGKSKVYTYDEFNQQTSEREVDGQATVTAYDRNGTVSQVSNTAGQVTKITSDKTGQPVAVTDAQSSTGIAYDKDGKVAQAKVQPAVTALFSNDFDAGLATGLTSLKGTWSVSGGQYRQALATGGSFKLNSPTFVTGVIELKYTPTVKNPNFSVDYRTNATDMASVGFFGNGWNWTSSQRPGLPVITPTSLEAGRQYSLRIEITSSTSTLYVDGIAVTSQSTYSPISSGWIQVDTNTPAAVDDLEVSPSYAPTSIANISYENTFSDALATGLTTAGGAWSVAAGEYAQASTAAGWATSALKSVPFSDGEVRFRVKKVSSAAAYGLRVIYRGSGSGSNYYADYNGTAWSLGANGVSASSKTASFAANQWYVIRIVTKGERTQLYLDDTLLLDTTFSKGLSSGTVELWTNGLSARFDDLRITAATQTTALTYDKNDNPTAITSSTAGVETVAYDKNDRQTSASIGGNSVGFTYDADGRVSQVSSTQGALNLGTTTFARDASGRTTGIKKPNGDTVALTYDSSSRVTSFVTTNKSSAVLKSLGYTYDANANVTKVTDNKGVSQSYSYDPRNELVAEGSVAYAYDALGNRTSKGSGSTLVKYGYYANTPNRLATVTNPDGSVVTYTYDKKGNLIRKDDPKLGTTAYEYNSDDKFTKAYLPGGGSVEYVYDQFTGLRSQRIEIAKNGTKTVTKFNFDGDRLVSETDLAGTIKRSYVWDENESLVSVSMPDSTGALATYFYVKNAKGDVLGLSDSAGTLLVEYAYDAWGNLARATQLGGPAGLSKANPRLYSSYWYDYTLGTYFMKTRLYDPTIGRFLSEDSVNTGDNAMGYNGYVYANNNPVNYVDSTGKFAFAATLMFFTAPAWLPEAIIGAAVAAVVVGAAYAIHEIYTQSSGSVSSVGNTASSSSTVSEGTGGGSISSPPPDDGNKPNRKQEKADNKAKGRDAMKKAAESRPKITTVSRVDAPELAKFNRITSFSKHALDRILERTYVSNPANIIKALTAPTAVKHAIDSLGRESIQFISRVPNSPGSTKMRTITVVLSKVGQLITLW